MFRKLSFEKTTWTYQTQRFFSTPIRFHQHPNYAWASAQWRQALPQHRVWLAQFDLAGTLVDEFCIAPYHAFSDLFSKRGFTLAPAQITGPMGLKKIEHIKHLLEEIREDWRKKYGKYPQAEEAEHLNQEFNRLLLEFLPFYTRLTPKANVALDFVFHHLSGFALTTGYPRFAADIAMYELIEHYPPTAVTTSDEVADGTRFAMIQENNSKLNLNPEHMKHIAFFTDAASDIANVRLANKSNKYPWIVGLSDTSTHNDIISLDAARKLSPEARQEKRIKVTNLLYENGAHCVIRDLSELPRALVGINDQLQQGCTPNEVRTFKLPYPPLLSAPSLGYT